MFRVAAAGLQTSNEYFLSTRGCAHFECGARHKFKLWRGVGVPRVAAWRAGGACGQCHGLACGSGNGRLGVRLWRVAKGVASRGVRFWGGGMAEGRGAGWGGPVVPEPARFNSSLPEPEYQQMEFVVGSRNGRF